MIALCRKLRYCRLARGSIGVNTVYVSHYVNDNLLSVETMVIRYQIYIICSLLNWQHALCQCKSLDTQGTRVGSRLRLLMLLTRTHQSEQKETVRLATHNEN